MLGLSGTKIIAIASSFALAYVIALKLFSNDDEYERYYDDIQNNVGVNNVTFAKIINCGNIQSEAKQYIEFLKNSQTFLENRVSMSRGCLLIGWLTRGKAQGSSLAFGWLILMCQPRSAGVAGWQHLFSNL